ncbi:hypothetical protein GGS23DRAFT_586178 [Durotheca rogersii]|uniref:uncharacterized protein n=1 Tax=Durotheca rogersii TaxID=419775 RepID=UPI00221FB1A9|nr:uncharacterized protein GGS23DRAFT_586178 [Durotheca rogersii]KAI5859374.1 hypothetical protein GGS23DRAFT_586178 [Durotheca rogersii]
MVSETNSLASFPPLSPFTYSDGNAAVKRTQAPPVGKIAVAATLVGLAFFGASNSIVPMAQNGLGKVLRENASPPSSAASVEGWASRIGAPAPFKRSFTGYAGADARLSLLVGFFASLIDDPGAGWDAWALYAWAATQLAAGWTALVLEGRRAGNRGRAVVSWIAALGVLFQILSWTLIVPLWLAAHLFLSPVARLGQGKKQYGSEAARERGDEARKALFVYLWDLALIPLAVTLTFIAPTIAMSLPRLLGHSAATHYNLIAFWQAFPVWTILTLSVLHNACYFLFGSLSPQDNSGRPTSLGKGFLTATAGVYQFGLTVSSAAHAPLLAISLLPAGARAALAAAVPPRLAPVVEQVAFARAFAVSAPLSIDPTAYGSGDLSPLVVRFLQYDLYTGGAALLLWAFYLNRSTAGSRVGWGRALGTTALWGLVGGPAAATLALLWQRDEIVREGEEEDETKKRT